jgi:hypothetical protein
MIRHSMPPASRPASSEPPESPVAEGDVLAGKYRVDKVLGSGGMGLVVAATHLTLHQKVALKFLLPSALDQPDTKERFLREARAAVRLKSEHVAKVVDVGTLDDGAPYMVMEYLDGATLGQVLRQQGALPIVDAVGFVLQACEAVAEAHAAGIVHRDLKPENLFLTRRVDGQPLVKVLDFGIAKTTGVDLQLSLTRTSTIVGSPLYMPPEQLRSAKHVDARSDIWAMGAVLFELLTGRLPFMADSFSELCMKVAQDPPPKPSALRAEIAPEIDVVVLRCLEKEPGRRFQNVGDLAEALQPFAPEDARDFAKRVTSVLAAGSWPPLQRAVPDSVPPPAKAATGTAWGQTSAGATKRRRLTWLGVGAGVCASVAVVVAMTGHSPSQPAAGSDPGTVTPPSPSPPVALAATQSVALVPLPPPALSSSAAASSDVPGAIAPNPAQRPHSPAIPAAVRPVNSPAVAVPVAPSAPAPVSPPATTSGGDIVFQRK